MRGLYFECERGISGDMTVAALLDLGADRSALERMLRSLPLTGFEAKISRVKKAGLDMCDFAVELERENHDHDMDYLYGHEHGDGHDHPHGDGHPHGQEAPVEHRHEHVLEPHAHEPVHVHEQTFAHEQGHIHLHDAGEVHDHGHTHDHSHDHGHTHDHHHTSLPEILHLLSHADMSPGAYALAEKTFRILAAAEARAHGVPEEQVHFHEVGAVDSIVDIASAAVLLDSLGVEAYIVPALNEGTGSVRCQHGILPVPVPAVANIAAEHGLTLRIVPQRGELVTPTGAAIAAAVRTLDRLPEGFRVLKIGMGAGKRVYERPSFLRLMLLEWEEAAPGDEIVKLETNVDDCTPEALGYVMERLLEAGARDVFFTPVYMKKQRPGTLLTVLCDEAHRAALEAILFRETTTIGVRRVTMERTVLPRRGETVQTSLGPVQVKCVVTPEGERRCPEQESVAQLCRSSGKSWQSVMKTLEKEL